MLTILTNPSRHNFSKSPIVCEIETDNMLTSGNFGDKAKMIFYVPPNPADGDEFYLWTGLHAGYFYFTNGINPFKWVVPLRAGGQTDLQYYNTVLMAIQANPGITLNYVVTYVGGGGFVFEAQQAGPTYSNIGSNTVSTGFSFTNLQAGTDNFLTDVPRPNYKIGIDILVETTIPPTSTVAQVYSAEKEPFDNKVKFDIAKIVDTQLDYYFPTPNQNTSNLCNETAKQFWINVREMYGSPVADVVTTVGPTIELSAPGDTTTFRSYIIKAGLAPKWTKIMPTEQLGNYLWNNNLFLTVRPSSVKIKVFQPEYLYYCFPATCSQPVLKITTYLKNGTTSTAYESLFIGNMPIGSIGCFPVNFSGSIINTALSVGNAVKFTVQIVADADHTTGISPVKTYFADYEPKGENKVFLFNNSLGGADTFVSRGNYEQDYDFEKEVSTRFYYTTDDAHLGDEVESQNTKQDVFKVFSGWLSDEQLHAMEELLLSIYKVEVIDGGFYIPITITSKKYRRHETNVFLKGIEIEYYHQIKSPVTDRLSGTL